MTAFNNLLCGINDPVGQITPPIPPIDDPKKGLMALLSNFIKLIITVGGLFCFFNILLAGFGFMTAGGDSKKIAQAWNKIIQSILGLVVMIGSFVLIAILGYLVCQDVLCFLKPTIYGPQ
jgi:hypothetical protein